MSDMKQALSMHWRSIRGDSFDHTRFRILGNSYVWELHAMMSKNLVRAGVILNTSRYEECVSFYQHFS